MGLNCMEGIVINEELAWGCTGIATAIEACSLAEAPLLVAATHEQKKEYLGRMTAEPIQAGGCFALPCFWVVLFSPLLSLSRCGAASLALLVGCGVCCAHACFCDAAPRCGLGVLMSSVRGDGAWRWIGCCGCEDHGSAEGRRVGVEWLQDVDHQRRCRELVSGTQGTTHSIPQKSLCHAPARKACIQLSLQSDVMLLTGFRSPSLDAWPVFPSCAQVLRAGTV